MIFPKFLVIYCVCSSELILCIMLSLGNIMLPHTFLFSDLTSSTTGLFKNVETIYSVLITELSFGAELCLGLWAQQSDRDLA